MHGLDSHSFRNQNKKVNHSNALFQMEEAWKKKHVTFTKMPSHTMVGILALGLVVIMGLVASIILIQLNQDVRQQATGDAYSNICCTFNNGASFSYNTRIMCEGNGGTVVSLSQCQAGSGSDIGTPTGTNSCGVNFNHLATRCSSDQRAQETCINGAISRNVCSAGYYCDNTSLTCVAAATLTQGNAECRQNADCRPGFRCDQSRLTCVLIERVQQTEDVCCTFNSGTSFSYTVRSLCESNGGQVASSVQCELGNVQGTGGVNGTNSCGRGFDHLATRCSIDQKVQETCINGAISINPCSPGYHCDFSSDRCEPSTGSRANSSVACAKGYYCQLGYVCDRPTNTCVPDLSQVNALLEDVTQSIGLASSGVNPYDCHIYNAHSCIDGIWCGADGIPTNLACNTGVACGDTKDGECDSRQFVCINGQKYFNQNYCSTPYQDFVSSGKCTLTTKNSCIDGYWCGSDGLPVRIVCGNNVACGETPDGECTGQGMICINGREHGFAGCTRAWRPDVENYCHTTSCSEGYFCDEKKDECIAVLEFCDSGLIIDGNCITQVALNNLPPRGSLEWCVAFPGDGECFKYSCNELSANSCINGSWCNAQALTENRACDTGRACGSIPDGRCDGDGNRCVDGQLLEGNGCESVVNVRIDYDQPYCPPTQIPFTPCSNQCGQSGIANFLGVCKQGSDKLANIVAEDEYNSVALGETCGGEDTLCRCAGLSVIQSGQVCSLFNAALYFNYNVENDDSGRMMLADNGELVQCTIEDRIRGEACHFIEGEEIEITYDLRNNERALGDGEEILAEYKNGAPLQPMMFPETYADIDDLVVDIQERVDVIQVGSWEEMVEYLWDPYQGLYVRWDETVDEQGVHFENAEFQGMYATYRQRENANYFNGVIIVRQSDYENGMRPEVAQRFTNDEIRDLPLEVLEYLSFMYPTTEALQDARDQGMLVPSEVRGTIIVLPDEVIDDTEFLAQHVDGMTPIAMAVAETSDGSTYIPWPPNIDYLFVDSEPLTIGTGATVMRIGNNDYVVPIATGWRHEEVHLVGSTDDLYRFILQPDSYGYINVSDTNDSNYQPTAVRNYLSGWEENSVVFSGYGTDDVMSSAFEVDSTITPISGLQIAVAGQAGITSGMADATTFTALPSGFEYQVTVVDGTTGLDITPPAMTAFGTPVTEGDVLNFNEIYQAEINENTVTLGEPIPTSGSGADIDGNYMVGVDVTQDGETFTLPVPNTFYLLQRFSDPLSNQVTDPYSLNIEVNDIQGTLDELEVQNHDANFHINIIIIPDSEISNYNTMSSAVIATATIEVDPSLVRDPNVGYSMVWVAEAVPNSESI